MRANLASIRGRIEVDTEPGASTEFRVFVPVSLSVLQCLVVRCGPQPYAIPLGPGHPSHGRPARGLRARILTALVTRGSGVPHAALLARPAL